MLKIYKNIKNPSQDLLYSAIMTFPLVPTEFNFLFTPNLHRLNGKQAIPITEKSKRYRHTNILFNSELKIVYDFSRNQFVYGFNIPTYEPRQVSDFITGKRVEIISLELDSPSGYKNKHKLEKGFNKAKKELLTIFDNGYYLNEFSLKNKNVSLHLINISDMTPKLAVDIHNRNLEQSISKWFESLKK